MLTLLFQSLKYWETLEQPYCNFTLMRADSERVLQQAITVASKETKTVLSLAQEVALEKSNVILEVVQEKTRPVVDKVMVVVDPFFNKAEAWYSINLKATVDSSIVPFYHTKVAPGINRCRDLSLEGWTEAKLLTKRGWEFTVATANIVSQILLDMVEDTDAKKWMPEFIVSLLNYAVNNTEDFIIFILQIFAAALVFLFRVKLRSLVTALLMLPFRMMWFLCPLRFFVKGEKCSPVETPKDINAEPVSS